MPHLAVTELFVKAVAQYEALREFSAARFGQEHEEPLSARELIPDDIVAAVGECAGMDFRRRERDIRGIRTAPALSRVV